MNAITGIALSGLRAADARLQASSLNIANARSSGAAPPAPGSAVYQPVEVRQSALAAGGVSAALAPSARAALLSYDPSAPYANSQGYVASPAVDIIDETVQLMAARDSFIANLRVLRTSGEMQDDVLSILT